MYATAEAHAAKCVFSAIRPMLTLALMVEPALNPNQANHKIKPPNATKGKL